MEFENVALHLNELKRQKKINSWEYSIFPDESFGDSGLYFIVVIHGYNTYFWLSDMMNNNEIDKKLKIKAERKEAKIYQAARVEWLESRKKMVAENCLITVKGKTAEIKTPDGKIFTKRLFTKGFSIFQ